MVRNSIYVGRVENPDYGVSTRGDFEPLKQRLQQLFFPEGIAFDGNRFNRTAAAAPLFKYLAPVRVLMKEW
jgi:hypothetical protein